MSVRSAITPIACGIVMAMTGTTGVTAAAPSNDQELAALRQQIAELRQRVEALEARLDARAPAKTATELQPIAGGWRESDNWKLLKKGMSYHRVKDVLGEPEATRNIGKYQIWKYPNGEVKLYLRRVTSWSQ